MQKIDSKTKSHTGTLIADEMSIQQLREWRKKLSRIQGFTDYYSDIIVDDPDEIPCNALVLMLVGMKRQWKYPVGYNLTNKFSTENHSFCLPY